MLDYLCDYSLVGEPVGSVRGTALDGLLCEPRLVGAAAERSWHWLPGASVELQRYQQFLPHSLALLGSILRDSCFVPYLQPLFVEVRKKQRRRSLAAALKLADNDHA